MERSLQEARNVADRWLEKAATEYGLPTYANYSNMLATRNEEQTRDEIHGCRSSESISRSEGSISYPLTAATNDVVVTASHSFDSTTVASGVDFHQDHLDAELTMAFSDLTLDAYSICSLLSNERDESLSLDEQSLDDISPMNGKPFNSVRAFDENIDTHHLSPKLTNQHDAKVNGIVNQVDVFAIITTPKITNRVHI
jgi:hypothetical protein